MDAYLEGAFLGPGFSTTPFNWNTPFSTSAAGSMMPYFSVPSASVGITPKTGSPYFSKVLIICAKRGTRPVITSSPNKTAKGSSPIKCRTFWMGVALPYGPFCLTYTKRARRPIFLICSKALNFFWRLSQDSNSWLSSKWSSTARLAELVTKNISVMPEATASSTTYWITGLSMMGSISLGMALVAGKKRVPKPATGKTALVIIFNN